MEQFSWPEILNGPRRPQASDVERGEGERKAPWREPDEASESGESAWSMYHTHQQQQHQNPVIVSALEPVVVRTDRSDRDAVGEGTGDAM